MNRLDAVSTRMGPDLRDAIEAMPGLGGVALWVKFLDSDDPELIAHTDGIHVEAGPRYEKYDDAERRFIVLHELLPMTTVKCGATVPARFTLNLSD